MKPKTPPGTQVSVPLDLGWALARATFQVEFRTEAFGWTLYHREPVLEERMTLTDLTLCAPASEGEPASSFIIDSRGIKRLRKLFTDPPPPLPLSALEEGPLEEAL